MATSQPPPRAKPLIAAITGFGDLSRLVAQEWKKIKDKPDKTKKYFEESDRLKSEIAVNSPAVDKAKRAPSGYILFSKDKRPEIVKANPELSFGDTGKKLGAAWKAADEKVKAKYNKMSDELKAAMPKASPKAKASPKTKAPPKAKKTAAKKPAAKKPAARKPKTPEESDDDSEEESESDEESDASESASGSSSSSESSVENVKNVKGQSKTSVRRGASPSSQRSPKKSESSSSSDSSSN